MSFLCFRVGVFLWVCPSRPLHVSQYLILYTISIIILRLYVLLVFPCWCLPLGLSQQTPSCVAIPYSLYDFHYYIEIVCPSCVSVLVSSFGSVPADPFMCRNTLFFIASMPLMSHNQNPALKRATQNHVNNTEGGYPQIFMARGFFLTTLHFPGF